MEGQRGKIIPSARDGGSPGDETPTVIDAASGLRGASSHCRDRLLAFIQAQGCESAGQSPNTDFEYGSAKLTQPRASATPSRNSFGTNKNSFYFERIPFPKPYL
jgi:hypothetical protein